MLGIGHEICDLVKLIQGKSDTNYEKFCVKTIFAWFVSCRKIRKLTIFFMILDFTFCTLYCVRLVHYFFILFKFCLFLIDKNLSRGKSDQLYLLWVHVNTKWQSKGLIQTTGKTILKKTGHLARKSRLDSMYWKPRTGMHINQSINLFIYFAYSVFIMLANPY